MEYFVSKHLLLKLSLSDIFPTRFSRNKPLKKIGKIKLRILRYYSYSDNNLQLYEWIKLNIGKCSTFSVLMIKQGGFAPLKNMFPTISAAWVLAILRHDLNLSSQEQCMTVWILWLVRPHCVAPGSMLIGHPRSCWRQHLSAPA